MEILMSTDEIVSIDDDIAGPADALMAEHTELVEKQVERQERANKKHTRLTDNLTQPILNEMNRPVRSHVVTLQTWHAQRAVKNFSAVDLYIHYTFHMRNTTSNADVLITLEEAENAAEKVITKFEKKIDSQIGELKTIMADNGCDGLVSFSNPATNTMTTSTPISARLLRTIQRFDILLQMAETLYQDDVWKNQTRIQYLNEYNASLRTVYRTLASLGIGSFRARYPKQPRADKISSDAGN
jgi:hypothetical protein